MPAVRTPLEMMHIAMDKLSARTGKSMAEWVEIARATGITTHKALTEHMKSTHGLNHNEAQWVAWEITDPGRMAQYDKPADLVADLYVGKKAALRPVYDALLAAGLALGDDVTSFVCKGYTSLSTGTQFVIFAPRTNSALDVELVLPEDYGGGEPFKSSSPRFNRRFRLKSPDEVTGAVTAALAAARAHVRG